ncbi:MAG TPA: glycosyltransferase family 4 protein [Gemmatimonadaceae bacterium]|nr:glycosyltransferase family 4 protein [Gemmatimonadaceae bacterium]
MKEPTDPLVILHVTAPARVGGLERVVEALCVGHAGAGHSVHVVAVVDKADDAGAFLNSLEAHGVHSHRLVLPGRAYRQERQEIRRLCRSLQPSVMHTHGYRADVATSGVARRLGIPTVSTVHGFTGGSWRNRLYEALQVRAFRRFGAVVAVSNPLYALLLQRGVPQTRLKLIVNAWSSLSTPMSRSAARAQLGLPEREVCIGWLGRLTREKGADVLIRAMPDLPDNVFVSFIGDGREREALQTLATQLNVSSRIRWHGILSSAGPLLSAFDAFVLSSRTEGTPIALFEAMAAGIPVVATRVGGVPEVVTDKEAVLVPSEDPTALAGAIRRTLDEPALAAARAESSRSRLETSFAVEPWLAAYENLYRQVGAAR